MTKSTQKARNPDFSPIISPGESRFPGNAFLGKHHLEIWGSLQRQLRSRNSCISVGYFSGGLSNFNIKSKFGYFLRDSRNSHIFKFLRVMHHLFHEKMLLPPRKPHIWAPRLPNRLSGENGTPKFGGRGYNQRNHVLAIVFDLFPPYTPQDQRDGDCQITLCEAESHQRRFDPELLFLEKSWNFWRNFYCIF